MSRLHVKILGIMAAIVVVATATAALRTGSSYWLNTFSALTFMLLLFAPIGARFNRRATGAFWFGFAVFGWGAFFLGLGPSVVRLDASEDSALTKLVGSLPVSQLVLLLVPQLRTETEDLEQVRAITATTAAIAHLVIILGLAVLGGVIAAGMKIRRKTQGAPTSGAPLNAAALILLGGVALASGSALSDHLRGRSAVYFPESAKQGPEGLSAFRIRWYTKHLRAMREAPLWGTPAGERSTAVYRLLWLPTFDHPVCVRIEGNAYHVRVLDGAGGYAPGQVAIDKSFLLGQAQRNEFERLLERAAFWDLPATPADKQGMEDGDQLILEGLRDGRYHVVDRQMAEPDYEDLCHYMIALSGLTLKGAWQNYHGH